MYCMKCESQLKTKSVSVCEAAVVASPVHCSTGLQRFRESYCSADTHLLNDTHHEDSASERERERDCLAEDIDIQNKDRWVVSCKQKKISLITADSESDSEISHTILSKAFFFFCSLFIN